MESSSASAAAKSPFKIPHEDVRALCNTPGFQLLRSYLAGQASFCAHHASCDEQTKETWLLHRDLLHALIMPVVELFKRASVLAGAALCATNSPDLELAFVGEARGAFLWLQCFVNEEEDWCRTRGCPACITTETLSTESHIRLTIAASLLSTASIPSPNSSPATSAASTPTSEDLPKTLEGPATLPPLPHILPALREALDHDSFWGSSYWPYLFSRANQLSASIQALISACMDLESLVASPRPSKPPQARNSTLPMVLRHSRPERGEQQHEEGGMRLKKSKLAKRQLRMKGEEMEIMRRCALQCWARAAVPSKMRNELLGKYERRRSLTCP